MDIETIFNRSQEVKKAKEESERSDLKQHADKMLRDFEKFNDLSSNRAIWELVQNACDLTVHCNIIIDYRNNKFSFTHNGRLFNSNSLISLIKQVSGDKDENSEIPPVGKYGTGFLTTHSLGRKFIINSMLQSSSGHFIKINDFLIDRSPKKWEDLSEQIRLQKDKVFEIIDTLGEVVENPEQLTTFTYLPETLQEIKYVTESYRDLEEYIPIVLTINNRLKSVKLISSEGIVTDFTLFFKDEIHNNESVKLYRTSIRKNGEERIIYSIAEPIYGIEIILPVDKNLTLFEFPERVARLFLYYPLIGSENFGMNFIINCSQFLPTEPRDGIHLNSNKDQVKDQEVTNKILIEKASELLFKFLKSNILQVKNPLLYANINFRRSTDNNPLNEYFSELQSKWVNQFKCLDIVETKTGYKKAFQVTFLNPALLEKEEYFESIYYLLDKFYTDIPSKQTIKYWSIFVNKWGLSEANFVSNDNIATHIQECSLSDFDYSLLKKYYEYLLSERHSELFTENKLLPNIDGEFKYMNILKRSHDLDIQLITIGKTLIPDAMAQLIDNDFLFDFNFDFYGRKDFSNSVNIKLNAELTDDCICLPLNCNTDNYTVDTKNNSNCLNIDYFIEILNYCKLHSNINSQSKPTKLMGLISDYYGVDNGLLQIESIADKENDIDIRQAQKCLVKVFFNTLEQHTQVWVENNLQFLHEIALYNEDRYKEVYSASKIYPNQLYKLCYLNELKKAINVDAESEKTTNLDKYITDLYNRTTGKIIEGTLSDINFNEFLTENETVTNKTLSIAIEEIFFETDIRDVNEHPFREDMLNIISKLNIIYYKDLFPRLDDKKANLMLDVVTNESTKDDIFSIVTLKEEQLKKLGKIVQLPNFEEILLQAEDTIRLDKEKKSDFEHKYKIGTYIEGKILEKLGVEIAQRLRINKKDKIDAENAQGGQDLIIYHNNIPLYYMEIKSRWSSNNSISMSKLQLERASEEFDRYSLVSVDITKYKGSNDKYELPLEEIIPLVKVVNNIGQIVKPLITNNLVAERNQSANVTLADYRGIINQDYINEGNEFEDFLVYLIEYLNKKMM